MTNKRIFQLSTLVIIVLIAILSISCKKKATSPSYSAEIEIIEPDVNRGIEQFEGKVYKSYGHVYKLNPNHVFSFSAEVKDGKIVVNRYNAKGEINQNGDYPHTYPVTDGKGYGPYTFKGNDKSLGNGNTLEINGQILYINGGKATFDANGDLTIVFQSGGAYETVKFTAQ